MPVLVHHGPRRALRLAPLRVRPASGRTTSDNLFACQFNLQQGQPPRARARAARRSRPRMRTSSSPTTLDFHPTDVLEDADGSLLVINTGGWYKLCCPSSQLVQARRARRHLSRPRKTARTEVERPARAEARLEDDGRRESGQAARRSAARGAPAGHRGAGRGEDRGRFPALAADSRRIASRRDAAAERRLGRDAGSTTTSPPPVRQAAGSIATKRSARRRFIPSSLWRDQDAVPALDRAAEQSLAPQPPGGRRGARADRRPVGRRRRCSKALAEPAERPGAGSFADLCPDRDRRKRRPAARRPNRGQSRRPPGGDRALDQTGAQLDPKPIITGLETPTPPFATRPAGSPAGIPSGIADLVAYLRTKLASPDRDEQTELVEAARQACKSPAIQQLLADTARQPCGNRSRGSLGIGGHGRLGSKGIARRPWLMASVELLDDDSAARRRRCWPPLRAVPPRQSTSRAIRPIAPESRRFIAAPAEVRLAALSLVPGGLKKFRHRPLRAASGFNRPRAAGAHRAAPPPMSFRRPS